MNHEFNPERKNPAFLAQFFNETLYKIPENNLEEKAESSVNNDLLNDTDTNEQADKPTTKEQGSEAKEEGYQTTTETLNNQGAVKEPAEDTHNQAGKEINEADPHPPITEKSEDSGDKSEKGGEIDYFGEFHKKILILVSYPNQKNLIKKEELVLCRILKALELEFKDVAVVNIQKCQKNFEQLSEYFSFRLAVAFGIHPEFLPGSLEANEIHTLENDRKVTLAPTLSEIAASKQLKRQLWQNLKTLFNQ